MDRYSLKQEFNELTSHPQKSSKTFLLVSSMDEETRAVAAFNDFAASCDGTLKPSSDGTNFTILMNISELASVFETAEKRSEELK